MSGRLENDSLKLLELKLNLEGNMADKIQNAYETSKNIYDDVLTQRNIFSKLYIKLFWSGTDDNDIARNYQRKKFHSVRRIQCTYEQYYCGIHRGHRGY